MKNNQIFPGRVCLQQRVVPDYRIGFFDLLAEACRGGLSVFAGQVQQDESIPVSGELKVAKYSATRNRHFNDVQNPFYLLWQDGILDWLEKWNPDALIVEANPRYLSSFKAIKWMHSRGRPVIGWGLGVPGNISEPQEIRSISNMVRTKLRTRLLKQLDAIIAYSQKGAQEYRSAAPEKAVYVATNAVARPPAGPPPERGDQFEGRPIVLFVGRLQARKRLDLLLTACANLPEGLQPILWIVGEGPESSSLVDLSSKIYQNTEFKGRKTGTELAEIFRAADIFVLPGTGGLAVQEAMSYALPVIVAEGDGTQGDLVKPENGWLIPTDDEEALTDTLKFALSDPINLRKLGQNSFKLVQEQVNIDQMVHTFVTALNKTSYSGKI